MNDSLRNSLWNSLDTMLWSTKDFLWRDYGSPEMVGFSRQLWSQHLKRPMDTIPDNSYKTLKEIRSMFFEFSWNEVYDFIEFTAAYLARRYKPVYDYLNSILQEELSAYRFVNEQLTDITSQQEIEMLETALTDSRFSGVSAHLQRALELYSNRENPDYRNSIKESISAVESMARIVAENPKATLGDALATIEKKGNLHKALKAGFLSLYGYTSDEGGIRHAMLEEPKLTANDARYFLLSCTSFVNYLKSELA